MLTDFLIIAGLLLFNAFFAMAELAIVSARRARLRQIAEEQKSKGARRAIELAEDPSSFLSIVQVGVTLNSILTGAVSGATLAETFGVYLNEIPALYPHGETLGFILTVGGVSYLSLVIGELVPKRIGLSYAEVIAVRVAGIMCFFARLFSPIVIVLKFSTDIVLRLLRLHQPSEQAVTEEEIKDLIAEGTEKGVFKQAEKEMLEGVMRLSDWTVRTIMTPRIDMIWLGSDDTLEDNVREMISSGHSRFPVARGDMEEVLGIVHAKDLLDAVLAGEHPDLLGVMRPAMIVPDTTSVIRLLDMFRQSGQHQAIIIDEYGSVEGLVTATDVLEAIIGALPDQDEEGEGRPVQREDGSWLIDGMTPIGEVETLIGMRNLHGDAEFHTLAGLMIDRLGRIPTAGDHFHIDDARFEVVDMDGRRVDKVLIYPPARILDERDEEID